MKNFILSLFLTFSAVGFSQVTPGKGADNRVYQLNAVDEKPELEGKISFADFFKKNFHPKEKTANPIELTFMIEKNGLAMNIKTQNPEDANSKEAVRVVKSAPKWKLGKKDGKVVRVLYKFTYKQ